MTQNKQDPILCRSSVSDFIVFKADSKLKEETFTHRSGDVSKGLINIFPNMLVGKYFTDDTIDKLQKSNKFCVFAVKMDDLETSTNSKLSIMIDIANAINSLCDTKEKFWGLIDYNIFGCFFDGINALESFKIAKELQKRISEKTSDTVTIGIADYPLLNFKREEIVENAYQSIDHASFFGHGKIVCFDAVTLNINADKLYQEKDINGAIKKFKIALKIEPSNVNIHNSLGVCYGVTQDYEKALNEFEIALWLNPKEVMAIYNSGLIYMMKENKDKALELFLEAYSIDNNVFEVLFQIGKLYYEKEEYEKAIFYLKKAVHIKDDAEVPQRLLGDSYKAVNNIDNAVAAYKKAIKINPDDASSLSSLGILFDLKGENPEISTLLCKQSTTIEPQNGLFKHRLAQLYFKQNMFKAALKEFKAASDLGYDSMDFIKKIENILAS